MNAIAADYAHKWANREFYDLDMRERREFREAMQAAQPSDPITESELFQNAVAAMDDVDFLSEEGHRPEMTAALEREERTLVFLYRWSCERGERGKA